jgi:hypothetical protein
LFAIDSFYAVYLSFVCGPAPLIDYPGFFPQNKHNSADTSLRQKETEYQWRACLRRKTRAGSPE